MKTDPLSLQIMWDRLLSVVEEQAATLVRAAFSPIVRECGDLSAGVFDKEGRMLAQAVTGTPGHVNSMAESVQHFLERFPLAEMQEGDSFLTNDPWKGTGHLNDFVLVSPAFLKGRPVALFACTAHFTDVGGIGFGPDGSDVHMEGLYLPLVKFVEKGKIDRQILEICKANSRLPLEIEGDLFSLISCNEVGCRRLSAMLEEFDADNLEALARHILARSNEAVVAEVARLKPGSYSYRMMLDGYEGPIELAARTTIEPGCITVDFAGSSSTVRRGINVPGSYARAYTCFGLMCAVAPRVPNNAGSLAVFEVRAPLGTILNAPHPAPVSSRHIIGQMLPDMVFGCLSQAIPERCPAEGTSCLWNMTFRGPRAGMEKNGYAFAFTMTSNGGTGARPDRDGLNATAFPSGVKGTPVEIVEAATPLIFWRKELRSESGGIGRHRGGHGQIIEVAHRDGLPFEILAAFDRIDHPPRGRDGGGDGRGGYLGTSKGRRLNGKGAQVIFPDEILIVETPGGGGIGNPAERSPELLLQDETAELS